MTPKDLDTRFEEALAIAEEMTQASLPQDITEVATVCLLQTSYFWQFKSQTIFIKSYPRYFQDQCMDANKPSHCRPSKKECYIEMIHSLVKKK